MTAIDSGRQIDEAQRLYDAGDLDAAAAIFATLASDAAAPDQASAAVGLSVTAEAHGPDPAWRRTPPPRRPTSCSRRWPCRASPTRPGSRSCWASPTWRWPAPSSRSRWKRGPDADTAALAIELLARTLPLRGRDADAETVWSYGLDHEDADLAAQVEMRRGRA